MAPIRSSRNPELLQSVLEVASQQFHALLAGKSKSKNEVGIKAVHLLSQLECLRGRDDKATEFKKVRPAMLCRRRNELAAVKADVSGART